jgi:sialate O-acetylesterase
MDGGENARGVGLAVTVDTGEAEDIHPKDKLDVGRRLATLARGFVYRESVVYGAFLQGNEGGRDKIRISFDLPLPD